MINDSGELNRFVGRRHELSEIRRLLGTTRLVTLTGMGGAGKTRLARRAAADLVRAHEGGAWLVELADLLDPQLLGHTVAGAIGLPVPPGEWQLSTLTDYLESRHSLLVLDNCEHLRSACADLVGGLLDSCPRVSVLATSRQALGLKGEAILQVPPLSLPDLGRATPVESLAQYESVTLLVERATLAQPTFRLTDENAPAVAQLCHALEGMPLALELAGARIRVLSPQEMLSRLGVQDEVLGQGFHDSPTRQQSLRASVEYSYELCTDQERLLWARLSVFTGGFELDAAEAVCAGKGLQAGEILDVIASLVDKSVLVRSDSAGDAPARFRMLEPIRQYGYATLKRAGDLDEWRRRHLAWHTDLTERAHAQWASPRQLAWLSRIRRELPNLRAALELALTDASLAPLALRMGVAIEGYWETGKMSEARHWLEMALAHDAGTPEERALAYRLCAFFGVMQFNIDYAETMLEHARPLAAAAESDVARAYVLHTSGTLAFWRGEVESGIEQIRRAADWFRDLGLVNAEAQSLFMAGLALGLSGDLDSAVAANERCLALTEAHGEVVTRSFALYALGLGSLAAGELERASQLEKEALRMKRTLEDSVGMGLIYEALGWVAAVEERAERSAMLFGAADAIWQVVGMTPSAMQFISAPRAEGEKRARAALGGPAFEKAVNRGVVLSPDEATTLALEETVPPSGTAPATSASPLTRREQEIAELLGQGLSNREIADKLVISVRTAQSHVENILRKLGFTSRSQVAAWVVGHKAQSRPVNGDH